MKTTTHRTLGAMLTALAMTLVVGCSGDDDKSSPMAPGGATGRLAITTETTGRQLDADGYRLSVDGGPEMTIDVSETLNLDLAPGSHTVTLSDVANNCDYTGTLTRPVLVTEGQTSEVTFTVGCAAQLDDQILFSSDRNGSDEVYVMNSDGTNVSRLTDTGSAHDAAVSPDGRSIAYHLGTGGIWLMDADGENRRELVTLGFDAAWSPDGTKLAYVVETISESDIYVINADGSGATNLTLTDNVHELEPSWSPDGSQLVYTRDDGGASQIYVMGSDGSNPTDLVDALGREQSPAWSPDGSLIVYTSDLPAPVDVIGADDFDIHTIAPDGTNDRRLTVNNTYDGRPSWSPDGSRIVYTTNVAGNLEIYTMTSTGSEKRNITGHVAEDRNGPGAWSR